MASAMKASEKMEISDFILNALYTEWPMRSKLINSVPAGLGSRYLKFGNGIRSQRVFPAMV